LRIIFSAFQTRSSAQDGHREKLKTVLESPGNKESDYVLKTFLCICEGTYEVKLPRTPMCGARREEWDCGTDVAHRDQG
jgi:hypothetical protein